MRVATPRNLALSLRKRAQRFARSLFVNVQRPFCEDVLVLGDSHAAVFAEARLRLQLWRYCVQVVSVRGATASGLENPNSTTQAFQKFEAALKTTRANRVIVLLGEVDAGFVIWYRAQKHGVSVGAALGDTCATYSAFLASLGARGLTPICVSAPLPTIENGNDWGEVANLRRSVTATKGQRTELTLTFNRRMAASCHAHGIVYLDLDATSLGTDGLVDPALLSRNPLDHHYDKLSYAGLLLEPVVQALRQRRAQPLGQPAANVSVRAAPNVFQVDKRRQVRPRREPSLAASREKRPH